MNARRVVISGNVQGVGYRAWTVRAAEKLSLSGWVRNRSDGTVEAVFCGEDELITLMIELCKSGPALSRVDNMEIFTHQESGTAPGFIKKPTV